MTTPQLVDIAIQNLREFEPPEGYYLAFSGGKDSCVIKTLADMAGVKYDAHYSVTTIDPPDLVRFIKQYHKDVIFERPEMPLLKKLETKGFPIRQGRWYCELYKENGGDGRMVITGIRAQESSRRAKRRMVEICYKGTGKRYLNIIHDWTELDVWDFIKSNHIPYCSLYDEGWKRIGCLCCPMATTKQRIMHLKKYPGYERLFRKSFERLYTNRVQAGKESVKRWKDGNAMFDWWIGIENGEPDQKVLFE